MPGAKLKALMAVLSSWSVVYVRKGNDLPSLQKLDGKNLAVVKDGTWFQIGGFVRSDAGYRHPDHPGPGWCLRAQAFFRVCTGKCLSCRWCHLYAHGRIDRG
ncbi:MAG TPA: hypothetical protein ENG92_02480 [Thiolapillus brandeum]|uniref:Uncharacterized protein n=1 Tax=Thiolapillus brandeum TaxID=1076588 RepID=A0A831NTC4_9GAMM|nr:hypothetical protein [Thiolapillus brandeum]